MALNDVWRVSCVGSHLGSELAIVTLHVRETSGVAETATVCGYIKNDLLSPMKTWQATTFRWDLLNLLKVNTTPKVSEEYTTGFPLTGEAVGQDELPHQVANVITVKTAYAGRSYRGRMYLPAFTEATFANGFFIAGHITNVQGLYTTLLGHIGSAGTDTDWRWVVWSDKLNVANNVTSVIVRNNPGVIRRRRIGVGQ